MSSTNSAIPSASSSSAYIPNNQNTNTNVNPSVTAGISVGIVLAFIIFGGAIGRVAWVRNWISLRGKERIRNGMRSVMNHVSAVRNYTYSTLPDYKFRPVPIPSSSSPTTMTGNHDEKLGRGNRTLSVARIRSLSSSTPLVKSEKSMYGSLNDNDKSSNGSNHLQL